jgi:hypothetical protein
LESCLQHPFSNPEDDACVLDVGKGFLDFSLANQEINEEKVNGSVLRIDAMHLAKQMLRPLEFSRFACRRVVPVPCFSGKRRQEKTAFQKVERGFPIVVV